MKLLPLNFEITFELDNGEWKTVPYFIVNSPYSKRWLDLWYNAAKDQTLMCWHKKQSIKDRESLIKECNELITALNVEKQSDLPLVEILNFDTFNDLHYRFETNLPRDDANPLWSDLNILIHKLENLILDEEAEEKNLMSIINHTNMYDKISVDNDWLPWQVMRSRWGDMVAGYATTGKNWLDVFATNDLELIAKDGVKIQERIMAEFYLTYHYYRPIRKRDEYLEHLQDIDIRSDFVKWKNQLPPDLKRKVPRNAQQLYLGKYILGRINIYQLQNFFPEFNKDLFFNDKSYRYAWYESWEKDFFSKISHVTRIHCYKNQYIAPVEGFKHEKYNFTILK